MAVDIGGFGTYFATMYTPLTDLIAVSTYINDAVPQSTSKMEIGFVSPADSYLFTIPYNMYQDGEWKFNTRQMAAALRKGPVVPL